MRKIIYNGIGNSDNEIRITTHWRKLNLHFFTINCKRGRLVSGRYAVRYEYETERCCCHPITTTIALSVPPTSTTHPPLDCVSFPFYTMMTKTYRFARKENEQGKRKKNNLKGMGKKHTLSHKARKGREKEEEEKIRTLYKENQNKYFIYIFVAFHFLSFLHSCYVFFFVQHFAFYLLV